MEFRLFYAKLITFQILFVGCLVVALCQGYAYNQMDEHHDVDEDLDELEKRMAFEEDDYLREMNHKDLLVELFKELLDLSVS